MNVREERAALPGTVRSTRQRAAITALLNRTDEFRSAQELHDALKRTGEGIGQTTVYRTLQSLSTSGEVDVLRNDTGESVYRRCSDGHHHHLVCQSCGFAVEVQAGAVEAWATNIAEEHGFTAVHHTVEVFGLCSRCSALRRNS